jgi:uncharacterized protein
VTAPASAGSAPTVVHNSKLNRFEATVDGETATLTYSAGPAVIDLQHTSVPETLRGKGLANTLAHAALDYARSARLKVIPPAALSGAATYAAPPPPLRAIRDLPLSTMGS